MQESGRVRSGKARAAKMTEAERHEASMKMLAAKRLRATMPKASYRGVITIGDIEIPCAVLEDGTRLISETGIQGNFGTTGGKARRIRQELAKEREAPIPLFLASKPLEPFIEAVFADGDLEPLEYISNGAITRGYNATILPKVCEVWLRANDAGVLQVSQLPKAKKAEVLMRGLAHIGIVALVDEATGYQDDRAKNALAKILEAFVAKELQPWVKTFPIDYYKELCRLYGVPFPPPKSNQFPQFFGRITNSAIYERLAPELLPELKKAAGRQAKKAKLHQFLTTDVGHPKLKEHLASVITLLKLSQSKEDFNRMLDKVHPKLNHTLPLDLE